MYFISRVMFPRGVAPQISVRRPGTILGKGWTKFNATNSAREVHGCPPVLRPDSPSLGPYLQNIQQEHRESNSVDGGEFSHDRQ